MKCRSCASPSLLPVIDLGFSPPSNAYLDAAALSSPEVYLPLRVLVCDTCWLVQTEDYIAPDSLFSKDYAYFSSTSSSWLAHARDYTEHVVEALALGEKSFVVELASNDGYLLRNFLDRGIPCLGIEPTSAAARVARNAGIEVVEDFFSVALAEELRQRFPKADLVIGNNVYAHVPDINDFTSGMAALLAAEGVITLEFPHLQKLLDSGAFDTIYHEHYSYLSLAAVRSIFARHGLRIWHVEELPTHGGSLRVYGCHRASTREATEAVERILRGEQAAGLLGMSRFREFARRAEATKNEFLGFLLECRKAGLRVAAYGAAAKGNTLLNYAGVRSDLLEFVCDAAPAKQGKFLPGSHIPIRRPDALRAEKPDVVILLPWNLRDELARDLAFVRDWGARLVIGMPGIEDVPIE